MKISQQGRGGAMLHLNLHMIKHELNESSTKKFFFSLSNTGKPNGMSQVVTEVGTQY